MRCSIIALCAVPVMTLGCVPQDRYDQLLTANRSLEEQLVAAEDSRDEARQGEAMLQRQLDQMRQSHTTLAGQYDTLNVSYDELSGEYDGLLERVTRVELGPLPPETEEALTSLAMAHEDVLSFDRTTGMLRFASDMTFGSGSVTLSEAALKTVSDIASILNDDDALMIGAQVIGHTDNVRIGKPATRQAHPTNVHLSVHRAIAVRDALVKSGINPARVGVGGYGEYRPIVENGRRGAAENRRVEIFLAPMRESERRAVTANAPATPESTPETPQRQPNK